MPVDDSYTKALLHLDGTDASTTFTDESGKTWTANGNAQIDTAQSKFGGASGLFDGTGDRIYTASHADFDFGSGNFTIDMWCRWNALPTAGNLQIFCNKRNSTANYSPFIIGIDNTTLYFLSSTSGTDWEVLITGSHGLSINTWYHFAYVRNGNVFTGYKNGTSFGTQTVSGALMTNSTDISIGAHANNADSMNGWIDEVRFSKGIARWTANFTPPTSAYAPPSSGGIGFFPFF